MTRHTDPIFTWGSEAYAHRQRVSGKLPLMPMERDTWNMRSYGFAFLCVVLLIGGLDMAGVL